MAYEVKTHIANNGTAYHRLGGMFPPTDFRTGEVQPNPDGLPVLRMSKFPAFPDPNGLVLDRDLGLEVVKHPNGMEGVLIFKTTRSRVYERVSLGMFQPLLDYETKQQKTWGEQQNRVWSLRVDEYVMVRPDVSVKPGLEIQLSENKPRPDDPNPNPRRPKLLLTLITRTPQTPVYGGGKPPEDATIVQPHEDPFDFQNEGTAPVGPYVEPTGDAFPRTAGYAGPEASATGSAGPDGPAGQSPDGQQRQSFVSPHNRNFEEDITF